MKNQDNNIHYNDLTEDELNKIFQEAYISGDLKNKLNADLIISHKIISKNKFDKFN